ncbi:MAG TPA: FecR domain-containing protein [Chitinophaga sp.]
MAMQRDHITLLIGEFLAGTLSAAEENALATAIRTASADDYEWLLQNYEQQLLHFSTDRPADQQLLANIQQKIRTREAELITDKPIRWMYYAAAAAVLLLLAVAGSWYWSGIKSPEDTPAMANVIKAGSNKALLTLADGSVVQLDSSSKVIPQGKTSIIQQQGQLKYTNGNAATVTYNTLTTPRGGQYELLLPDGSRVWLNAASSLYYPTAFTGKERKIVLSGEAYFEVVPDADKPFIVQSDKTTVQVLGTAFNIMAYADEPNQQTSLVNGSIKVAYQAQHTLVTPGNMAIVKEGTLSLAPADIEQVTAWKNGLLALNATSLKGLMRQVARWYDVEVRYEGEVPDRQFGGILSRNTQLSTLIQFLRKSGVNIKQTNRVITIMP